jgi:transcriptional regulator with XRE-family HTH domain
MDDTEEIARRIRDARAAKNMKNSAALAQKLRERSGKKGPSNEAVRLWETGKVVPPYPMIELLSIELDQPAEFLLFGIRRDQELADERRFLEYVGHDELALLTDYRRTTKSGRALIRENAGAVARRYPAANDALPPRRKAPGVHPTER